MMREASSGMDEAGWMLQMASDYHLLTRLSDEAQDWRSLDVRDSDLAPRGSVC